MNGNNILVCKETEPNNYVLIAGTRSNEIQSGSELIEISSPTQGTWRSYLAGRKEWSLTVSYLVSNVSQLQDLLTVGCTYKLFITDRNNTGHISGTAILKTCKHTYTVGNLCQGSFQFVGTSPLS